MALKPYLQLVRLPNVFTAVADSLAGWLLVGGTLAPARAWPWLLGASASVYAGGIVLNDVFDLGVDRLERPDRPLSSGRVRVWVALALGVSLLALGLGLAWGSGTARGGWVALALVACVLGYDAGLKRTPLGPEVMGMCRGLNLVLGMSDSPLLNTPEAWLAAGSYALFVSGVTWISRSEVGQGRPRNVMLGSAVQNLALIGWLAAACLWWRLASTDGRSAWLAPGLAVIVAIAIRVDLKARDALRHPGPSTVQAAVKAGIFALVLLHVGILLAVRGPMAALAVGWLWFPAVFAGRWIYST